MKTKLHSIISNANPEIVRARRADLLVSQMQTAQQTLINQLENEVLKQEHQIQKLLDFSPETTVDLTVGNDSFDPGNWARDLQLADERLKELNEKLEIAQANFEKLFTPATDQTTPAA